MSPQPEPSMRDAVRELYACDPADFVTRRKALVATARGAGDRALASEIGALRKPTVAAAFVNRLDEEDLASVLALGQELRAAQTRLDTDAMKDATARRQRLLHDIVTAHELSAAVAEDVRATLLAATADRAAADAVASRALVKPLRYSGWGDVELGDAVAHQAAMAATSTPRPALRLVEDGTVGEADGRADGEARRSGGGATGESADGDTHGSDGAPDERSEHEDASGATNDPVDAPTRDGATEASAQASSGASAPAADETSDTTAEAAAEAWRVAQRAASRAAERAEQARRKAASEAEAEIRRLETRLTAAQAAVDNATAARDAAATALDAARARLEALG